MPYSYHYEIAAIASSYGGKTTQWNKWIKYAYIITQSKLERHIFTFCIFSYVFGALSSHSNLGGQFPDILTSKKSYSKLFQSEVWNDRVGPIFFMIW